MDHRTVQGWIGAYERAWRTPGTAALSGLFTADASYRPSPWSPALRGLEAISEFWESERDGPDEAFTMAWDVVAVEGDTAVVRVEVVYLWAAEGRWRDLWVLRLNGDGLCREFDEWPFAPDQPDGH